MTTITMLGFTFQAFAFFLVIILASEANTAMNDVGYWRSVASRLSAMGDTYSKAAMFRAYRHADESFDAACGTVAMLLLTGFAGFVVAFIG